jgi:acetyl esterase/lipase
MKKTISAVLLAWTSLALAQEAPPLDPNFGISTIALYDGAAAQAAKIDPSDVPTLTVFRPQPGHGTGSAVIVAPGGAYTHLASNLEGSQVAVWFAARGFTAFVLKYRFGTKNLYPTPLLDAQRAIRLVRSLSKSYGISANRVGMVGFSAGGHLAATAGTLFDAGRNDSSDPVDHLSDRPDFLVLGYAWLNAMEPAVKDEITYCSVLKTLSAAQCAALTKPYTPKLHITANTPPTFLYATTDDGTVPVSASVEFYSAMVKAGASVEMHLFQRGPHGSGLGRGDASLDQWPVLLEQWLRAQNLLTVDPAVQPPT